MKLSIRNYVFCGIAFAMIIAFFGCQTLDTLTQVGVNIPVAGMNIDTRSLARAGKAVAATFEDFTPEQEYYVGRTIGAVVIDTYKPYSNPAANRYINLLGQTLAQASDMPETFGGYHFMILDSDEINAFAAPGGFIFVSRGLLRCCTSEDMVAAVLAHEIGHVQHKHGLQSIQKSRITTAITTIGIEGAKTVGGEELAAFTNTFSDSIMDISKTMINSGYSRAFEREADLTAVTLLKRVGYDPNSLAAMLKIMETRLKPGGIDFAKTHPEPQARIKSIQGAIQTSVPPATVNQRNNRFQRAMAKI